MRKMKTIIYEYRCRSQNKIIRDFVKYYTYATTK